MEITCSSCGDTKPANLDCFAKSRYKANFGFIRVCRTCVNIREKKYREKPQAKIKAKERDVKWRKSPIAIQRRRDWNKQFRTKYPEANKERNAKNAKKYTEQLTNGYIKQRLFSQYGLKASQVNDELIEAKRQHISLQRKLKQNEEPS